jgi:plasmid stabilization system protein ParE
MRLEWSDEAIISYVKLESFVFNQWGEEVAIDFSDLVDEKLALLRDNPRMGALVSNRPYRKLVIHANVSIYYLVANDVIRILLCWDNRSDPNELEKLLKP